MSRHPRKEARKTTSGFAFRNPQEFIDWISEGFYVCLGEKPIHPGFALSWRLKFILDSIKLHRISRCLDDHGCEPYAAYDKAA